MHDYGWGWAFIVDFYCRFLQFFLLILTFFFQSFHNFLPNSLKKHKKWGESEQWLHNHGGSD